MKPRISSSESYNISVLCICCNDKGFTVFLLSTVLRLQVHVWFVYMIQKRCIVAQMNLSVATTNSRLYPPFLLVSYHLCIHNVSYSHERTLTHNSVCCPTWWIFCWLPCIGIVRGLRQRGVNVFMSTGDSTRNGSHLDRLVFFLPGALESWIVGNLYGIELGSLRDVFMNEVLAASTYCRPTGKRPCHYFWLLSIPTSSHITDGPGIV